MGGDVVSPRTPGPWVIERAEDTLVVFVETADRLADLDICEVSWFDNRAPSRATAEANANLIAAAPDLLAALEKYQSANRLHNDAEAELFEFAAPAITKARGGK